ncbi:MAG: ATP-binding protein [Desulfobacterales bacterium]|nr:ATP-binding protein [Desulfobacterales bacterium]MDD4073240.1 ATP-binding protein [Desulfobacterales bacterium]MDD4394035.1 ATP-binding protein [Desulfobacterales bacterium]
MQKTTKLEDLIGFGHTKLGFFGEVQKKVQELQASNRELEQKRQEIQAILDGITDVIVVVTPDYRIQSVNQLFHSVFNVNTAENLLCHKVLRGRNHPCPECPMQKALETNSLNRGLSIIPLNGKNSHFEITASPLRDKNGHPESVLLLMRDVTMEKEYEAKYLYTEKMATIGLLAAGVAHEINNPLAAISGFAEGIKRRMPALDKCLGSSQSCRILADDFHEYIDTILTECNRCREIVKNLLTFSPRKQPEFLAIDINDLIEDIVKLLHHKLKHLPPGTVKLDLDRSIPYVRGISAELKQVILNLILNALDAIKSKGAISIHTRFEKDRWIIISVQDTGCGIPEKNIQHLFEPFFTTKPVGQGIGVGLSTCYNIIHQHDGEINVISQEGKGSTFEVKLPHSCD